MGNQSQNQTFLDIRGELNVYKKEPLNKIHNYISGHISSLL